MCPYGDDGECGCPPPAADAVTDAMVEAAGAALWDDTRLEIHADYVRRAIAAALAARGK
jgi:hypothetical protein